MSYGGYAALWAHARGGRKMVAPRDWSIADAPHGALAAVNRLLRSSVDDKDAAMMMREAWGFPEETIAGLLEIRARREDAMDDDDAVLVTRKELRETDRTIEALRRFALHAGRLLWWQYGTEDNYQPDTKAALADLREVLHELAEAPSGVDILQRAIDEATPKPEPALTDEALDAGLLKAERAVRSARIDRDLERATAEYAKRDAAKLMGALVSSVLDRATAAVRDEAGSQLCACTEGGTRTCWLDYGKPCLCRQVALAVIDVLEPKEA